jgi:hypothetical protein
MTTSTLAPAWMVCTCLLWMKNPSATTAVNLLVPLHAHNAWPSPTRLRMPAIIKLNRVTFSALTHCKKLLKRGSLHPHNPQR